MRVLHVIAPAKVGGAESVVLGLCDALSGAGIGCGVAAILRGNEPHPFPAAARARGIDTQELRAGHRDYLGLVLALRRAARRLGAQVIHSHGYLADVVAAAASWRGDVAHVSTLHGFTGDRAIDAFYDRIARFAQRRADAVIGVSAEIMDRLPARGVLGERAHLIRNAFAPARDALSREDARALLGITDDAPRIGWVGRVSSEKGPDLAVRALATLPPGAARLSVVGDGPARGEALALAEALGVADRIDWHGIRMGAARLLAAFDVLLLSSRTEGTPMILLEAMSAGLPIACTAVGGVPDMLSADEALLVAADDPGALGAAVLDAIRDRPAARARAASARARLAREFSSADWVASHIAVYLQVVGDRIDEVAA